MARKPFDLRLTRSAAKTSDSLRGKVRQKYVAFEHELKSQGCRAAGYRLLGPENGSYSNYCCSHIWQDWRVITTFSGTTAIIVSVGQHSDTSFYSYMSKELAISPIGQRRQHKPQCCGATGWPSLGATPP